MTCGREIAMKYKRFFTMILVAAAGFMASCDTVFTDVYDEVSRPRLYVFGGFTHMNGIMRSGFAELDLESGKLAGAESVFTVGSAQPVLYRDTLYYEAGGTLYASDFDTGAIRWTVIASSTIYTIVVNEDTVFIGGAFFTVDGQPREYFAQVRRDTGAVLPQLVGGLDNSVNALALSGDTLFLGGYFLTIDGQTRNRLAAVDIRSGDLKSWNPGADGYVGMLYVVGTTVYFTGGFGTIAGNARNSIAAVDAQSGALLPFNANITGGSATLCAFSNDTIYITGPGTIGGKVRSSLAAVDRTTGALRRWAPTPQSIPTSIVYNSGKVYMGGTFTTMNGVTRNYLAAVDGDLGELLGWYPIADSQVNYVILDR